MNIQQRIAERLVQARNDAGMSAIAVADAIGVVRQTYSKFEQAQGVPSVTQLIMLCKVFDKPIGYFYDQDDASFVLQCEQIALIYWTLNSAMN